MPDLIEITPTEIASQIETAYEAALRDSLPAGTSPQDIKAAAKKKVAAPDMQRLIAKAQKTVHHLQQPSEEARVSTQTEVDFALTWDGFTVRGTWDRVDVDPTGAVSIIDYKTSTRSAPFLNLRQLQLYAWVRFSGRPTPRLRKVDFFSFRHTKQCMEGCRK